MKIEAYREITDWSDTEYYVPNHTYLFDGKSNILAYAIEGTEDDSPAVSEVVIAQGNVRYRAIAAVIDNDFRFKQIRPPRTTT